MRAWEQTVAVERNGGLSKKVDVGNVSSSLYMFVPVAVAGILHLFWNRIYCLLRSLFGRG